MQLNKISASRPVAKAAQQRTAVAAPLPNAAAAHARRAAPRASVVAAASFFENAINALSVAVKNSPMNKGKVALAKAQAGEYDAAAVRARLDALIAGGAGGVTVFSFSTCPFCVKAKATLDAMGAKYTAVELDQLPNREGYQLRAELAERTDRTSMPSIWIAGECIGGCNDGTPGLLPLQREGKLEALLRAAGSLA